MREESVTDAAISALSGRCILIVEDEYLIAVDLARSLEDLGVVVLGPAGSVADALALAASEPLLDAAVLDVNLGSEQVFPVADALLARGIPFIFATGYDDWIVPDDYADAPRLQKPIDTRALARILSKGSSYHVLGDEREGGARGGD
jgi:CheY-like chemotaxis protein